MLSQRACERDRGYSVWNIVGHVRGTPWHGTSLRNIIVSIVVLFLPVSKHRPGEKPWWGRVYRLQPATDRFSRFSLCRGWERMCSGWCHCKNRLAALCDSAFDVVCDVWLWCMIVRFGFIGYLLLPWAMIRTKRRVNYMLRTGVKGKIHQVGDDKLWIYFQTERGGPALTNASWDSMLSLQLTLRSYHYVMMWAPILWSELSEIQLPKPETTWLLFNDFQVLQLVEVLRILALWRNTFNIFCK